MKRRKLATVPLALATLMLAACASQADVASKNLSKAAEQFEVYRRVIFFNGITDKYLLQIDGLCSVETDKAWLAGSLEVTCKTSPTEYKKHFLGLSDNVSFFVEQVEGIAVSEYRYRVIFRPDQIVPNLDLDTELGK